MKKSLSIFTILFYNYFFSLAQIPLISGPMLGYIEHREALVWLEVSKSTIKVEIKYWKQGDDNNFQKVEDDLDYGKDFKPVKLRLTNLDYNTVYEYQIQILEKVIYNSPIYTLKTKDIWEYRKPAPDFNFLLGSCTYINDSLYDRNYKPYGNSPKIFETMNKHKSDFMLWTGDNTYTRDADLSSEFGMQYRYSHTRKTPEIQAFLASRANYATWDDHDFGPNDGNGSYELKDKSLNTFKEYWGNKSFGESPYSGIYSKFKYSDCEFFLLDDRYFRSPNETKDSINGKPNPDKRMLGEKQMKWLKNSLLSSNATFKFIVSGGQVTNLMADKECMRQFPYEHNELINFLSDNKIEGVVIISGDRHFSEIVSYKPANFYTIYEFTCSALTSFPYAKLSEKPEFNNPQRVKDMLLIENNFGEIKVSGAKGQRQVTIKTFDIKDAKRFEYTIKEQDLEFKK